MFAKDLRLIDAVHSQFEPPVAKVERGPDYFAKDITFPQLIVTVPDDWPHVILAPLYDVHIGHSEHDAVLFERHCEWLAKTPYVLSFDGGDLIENASKLSVGAGVYEQDFTPQNQLVQAVLQLAKIKHKMMFKLPGNHEDRTNILGIDVGQWLAWLLDVPYFPDYVFVTIKFRGNNFRLLAHHGTGAAQTAGGQRMAARKDIASFGVFDLYWTGHLHNPLADLLFHADFNQQTGEMLERNAFIIISPPYLKYFRTYSAKRRYPPGQRGLAVVTLNEDGRMDLSLHARGRRP
jgi:hypothetical protein